MHTMLIGRAAVTGRSETVNLHVIDLRYYLLTYLLTYFLRKPVRVFCSE